jgi:hypothetical protein
MRTLFFCLIILVIGGLYNSVSAQDYKVAVGIRLSTAAPTINNSFSVKYFIDETNAVEGLASFGSRFGLGGLYERHQIVGVTPGFTWFYGGGGYVGFESGQTWFGPMGVVGLDYKFPTAPVNLSIDWKPELDIIPSINFVPDAFAVTVRFTFGNH